MDSEKGNPAPDPAGLLRFDKVFEQELEELGKRHALRANMDKGSVASAGAASDADLVGLCFSGGGIRSATYNLGVARGLYKWNILQTVDYLSTVSGGGYVGSNIANQFRIEKPDDVLQPYDKGEQGEPPGLKRLRGLGRFLTPEGSLGQWLMGITSLVRGVLWNVLFVVLVAVAAAALFSLLMEPVDPDIGETLAETRYKWSFYFPHGWASAGAVALSALVAMGSALRSAVPPSPRVLSGLAVATAGVVLLDALPTLVYYVGTANGMVEATAALSGLGGLAGSGVLSKVPAKLYNTLAQLFAILLVVVMPAALFLAALAHLITPPGEWVFAAVAGAVVVLAISLVLVDFNLTSLHGMYRLRVGETFLLDDPPKMSAFQGRRGPIHLVNVALNVPASGDKAVRDRLADFFTFSCLHAGGKRTGYVPIEEVEAAKSDFTLASAVAMSGAAAAPNMGSFTMGAFRPAMTLLNIRMGYWMPHPKAVVAGESGWMARLNYLFKEAMGDIDAKGKLVNLSDGGHLENLGAYELLRRKCKLIIIGDGEADPNVSMGAMSTLIRYASTDLNAAIEIDLDDVRPDEDGMSHKHAAMGTVLYEDGSVGRILYLKSSLTGHEPPDVLYYKANNPDFPHESTANQWFDDAQFDAYVGLGEEVVDSLFQSLGYTHPGPEAYCSDNREERLSALNVVLAPTSRSRSGELTNQLNEVQAALLDEQFSAYRTQLIPTIHKLDIPSDELHRLVPMVMMQLQLMENAVEGLGLIDIRNRRALANRGWINLFQRWGGSAAFQHVSLVCLPSFGANLAHFFDVALQLGNRFIWGAHPDKANFPNQLLLVENNPEIAPEGSMLGFVTGLLEQRTEGDRVIIDRMVMRGGFAGGDRVQAAVAALRATYPKKTIVWGDESLEQRTTRLPRDSYARNPARREWLPSDEQAVLDATRDVGHKPVPTPGGTTAGTTALGERREVEPMDFDAPAAQPSTEESEFDDMDDGPPAAALLSFQGPVWDDDDEEEEEEAGDEEKDGKDDDEG